MQAHALFNSCAVRQPDKKHWTTRAFEVQNAYWKGSAGIGYEDHMQLSERMACELQSIRGKYRHELEEVHQLTSRFPTLTNLTCDDSLISQLSQLMKSISMSCTEDIVQFAGSVMLESTKIIKKEPPCSFSVVAIGSIARGEASPYSDLEYLFLIEKKTPESIDYFQKLAMTSYFLIGNLRETKLSYMAIYELQGWFDDQAQNGFKIDGLSLGAGNIPTGNWRDKPNNHFIITIEELVAKYNDVHDNPQLEQALKGDLTAMLTYKTQIFSHGSDDMVVRLTHELKNTASNSPLRQGVDVQMLRSDIMKFNFKPGEEYLANQGFTIDAKRQLYRFASILLLDLAVVHDMKSNSSWETLELLLTTGRVSEKVHQTLLFILACACYIRLSAYLHHDAHDDRISVAPFSIPGGSVEHKSVPKSQQRWHIPTGLFYVLSDLMVPLKRKLENQQCNINEVLLDITVQSRVWADRAEVIHTCARYKDALRMLEAELGLKGIDGPVRILELVKASKSIDANSYDLVAEILFKNEYYAAALEIFKHLVEQGSNQDPTFVPLRIADCYNALSMHDEGLLTLDALPNKTASVNFRLGQLYHANHQPLKAAKHYVNALQVFCRMESENLLYDYYGNIIDNRCHKYQVVKKNKIDFVNLFPNERLRHINTASQDVIFCMSAYADLLSATAGTTQAIMVAEEYYMKTLFLCSELYGGETAIPLIASITYSLAMSYTKSRDYRKAEDCFLKALAIRLEIHGTDSNDSHIHAARIYSALGNSSNMCLEHIKARYYHTKSLDMQYKIHGTGKRHSDIAAVLSHLGIDCYYAKQYKGSLTYHREALIMYRNLYGQDSNHVSIGKVLNNMSCTYNSMGRYQEARKCFDDAVLILVESSEATALSEYLSQKILIGIEAEEEDKRRRMYANCYIPVRRPQPLHPNDQS